MKPTIKVSIGSVAFNLDEDAYRLLDGYLKALNKHFASNAEAEEIISDIELRLSELLQMRVASPDHVISAVDAEEIVKIMGNPKDFGDGSADETEVTTPSDGHSSGYKPEGTKEKVFDFQKKKLFRDMDHRILGGVCSGLGYYLRFDPVLIRIIWVVVFFACQFFSDNLAGSIIIAYLVLWFVMPKAVTFEDRLVMTGADPSILNIEDRTMQTSRKYRGTGFGEFVRSFSKVVFVMAAVLVLIGIISAFVSFGWMYFDTSVFYTSNYFTLFGVNSFAFSALLLLLLLLPLYGLFTIFVKILRESSFKTQNLVLLLLGVFVWIGAATYLGGQGISFVNKRDQYTAKEDIVIDSLVNTLTVKLDKAVESAHEQPNNPFVFYRGESIGEREICVLPRVIVVEDSTLNNFKVVLHKRAYGGNWESAQRVAEQAKLDYVLTDSVLTLSPEWYNVEKPWDLTNYRLCIHVPKDKKTDVDVMLKRRDRGNNRRFIEF